MPRYGGVFLWPQAIAIRPIRVCGQRIGQHATRVGISHHTFRHTHGSILLDEGSSIPEVSERLGHADPSITAAVYRTGRPTAGATCRSSMG
jgi:integrase